MSNSENENENWENENGENENGENEFFFENGENENGENENGKYKNLKSQFEKQIEKGQSINKIIDDAFLYNVSELNEDIIKFFIDKGATPTYILFKIIGRDDTYKLNFQDFLLKAGADVNALNSEGHTPLYYASMFGKMDQVEYLLDRGADPNKKGDNSGTPIEIASLRAGDSLFTREARDMYGEIVRYLVSRGANPNLPGSSGWVPINLAIYCNKPESVKLLLEVRASINKQKYPTEDRKGKYIFEFEKEPYFSEEINRLIREERAKNLSYVLSKNKRLPYPLEKNLAYMATGYKGVPIGGRRKSRARKTRARKTRARKTRARKI